MKKLYKKLGKRITAMALVLLMLASSGGASVFAEVAASPAPTAAAETQATPVPEDTSATATEPTPTEAPAPTEAPVPTEAPAPTEEPTPTEDPAAAAGEPTAQPEESPLPEDDASAAVTEPTPAPTEAPAPTPTATATPAPSAEPEAAANTLPKNGAQTLSEDTAATEETRTAQDMVELIDVTLGDNKVTFTIQDGDGNIISKIPDDAEFSLNIQYTIDNQWMYLIDGETTLYYDFPVELVLKGVGDDKVFDGNLTDPDYAGVPGTWRLAQDGEDGRWRLSFQYTDAYLQGRYSLTGGFTFQCKISDTVTDEKEQVVINFGGDGHTTPIKLDDVTITAEKTYVENVSENGTINFEVELDVNKLAKDVVITDTMGAAFEFQNPATFTLTGNNGYSATFSTADGTASVVGQILTINVGELRKGTYTLAYTANVVKRSGGASDEDASDEVASEDEKKNSVTVTYNGEPASHTIPVEWEDADNWLKKQGTVSEPDPNGMRTITWTIHLNDDYPRMDLSGLTLTDTMTLKQGVGVSYTEPAVAVTYTDTNEVYDGGTLTTNGDGFTYTFGNDAGTNRYTVVYTVKVSEKDLADDDYMVHNDVTLSKDGKILEEAEADVSWKVGHNDEVTFQGQKRVQGALPDATEFTFNLYEANENFEYDDAANPLDTKTVSVEGNSQGTVRFAPIEYDKDDVGQHYYVIKENVPAADDHVAGLEYDDTEWYITVSVEQEANGDVNATVTSRTTKNGEPVEWDREGNLFTFTNVYNSVTGTIPVQKTVTGEGASGGKFTFDLYEKDNASATVPDTAEPVKSVTVTASYDDGSQTITGTGDLQLPTYYSTDFGENETQKTYYYLLKENRSESISGLTYDTTGYNVAVTVTKEDGGGLTINNIHISGGQTNSGFDDDDYTLDALQDTAIPFVNTYDQTTVNFSGSKTLIGAELTDHADDFHFTIDRVYWDETADKYVAYSENQPEHYKEQVDLSITTGENGNTIGSFSFSEITYTEEDTYYYTVTEQIDQDSSCKCSTAGYFITVKVEKVNNELGQTVTVNPLDETTNGPDKSSTVAPNALNFKNVYQGVGIGITGNKIVNGNYASGAGYVFKLQKYVQDPNGKWVESGEAQEEESGTNSLFTFTLDYTADDLNGQKTATYYYSITEKDTGDSNTTYDKTTYWVRVILTLNPNETLRVQCDLVDELGSTNVTVGGTLNPDGTVSFGNAAGAGEHQGIYFANTVYTATSLTLHANKTLTITDSSSDRPLLGKFQFKLEKLVKDKSGKFVVDTEFTTQTESVVEDSSSSTSEQIKGSVTFDLPPYSYANDNGKTYYYKISEVIPESVDSNANPHTEYDENAYYIEVYVSADGYELKTTVTPMIMTADGTLQEDASKPEDNFSFENKYVYHETFADLALSGTKIVSETQGDYAGRYDIFEFVLTDAEGKKLATAKADPSTHQYTFNKENFFHFEKKGTYTYYLYEKQPTEDDASETGIVAYDQTRYMVVFTVTEDPNTHELTCSGPVISKVESNLVRRLLNSLQGTDTTVSGNELNFTNTYDEKELPPTVTLEKTAGNVSYKNGTAEWTLDVTVSNLKDNAPLTSLIITDKITTTGTGVDADATTIKGIKVQEVSADGTVINENVGYKPLTGDTYQDCDLAISITDRVEKNPNRPEGSLVDHIYRITYKTETKLQAGATMSGAEVHLENEAVVNWSTDYNSGSDDDSKEVDFGSLLEKQGTLIRQKELQLADETTEERMVIEWKINLDLTDIGDLTQATEFSIEDTMDSGLRYIGPDPNGGYTNVSSTLKDTSGTPVTINEPTVSGTVGEGQTLSWTFTGLERKQYTLTYYTEVTGAVFEADDDTSVSVSNDATLSQDEIEIGETTTEVEVTSTLLNKGSSVILPDGGVSDDNEEDDDEDSSQVEGYQVVYAIRVNADKMDLIPAKMEDEGVTLRLKDTLPEDTRILDGVRFYDGDQYYGYNDSRNQLLADGLCTSSIDQNEEGRTELSITLPDETYVVVEYVLGVLNHEQGSGVILQNTAELTGTITVTDTEESKFSYQMGDAYVRGTPGQLTIYKQDEHAAALPGATFTAYEIQQNGTIVERDSATNENGGTYVLEIGLDNLYYWTESTVPVGYQTASEKHYVVLLDQSPTEDAWLAKEETKTLLANLKEMDPSFNEADIEFYHKYGSATVVNQPLSTSITLSAEKQLDGAAFAVADTFSFTLKDAKGDTLQTKTNNADGTVTFDAISYNFHDVEDAETQNYTKTFTYTIQEKDVGSEAVYIYDQSVYTVEVTVSLNQNGTPDDRSDDTLEAEITSIQKDGEAQNATDVIIFNNLTSKTSISGTKVWELPEEVQVPGTDDITLTLYRYTETNPTPEEVPADEYKFEWTNTEGAEWTWTFDNLTRFTPAGNGQREEYIYFVTETLNAVNGEDYTFLPPVYTAPNGTDSGDNVSAEPDNGSAEAVEPAAQTPPAEDERAYNGYTITNRAVSEISVNLYATKYYYGLRPDQEFTFELVNADADGKEVDGTGDWDNQSPIVVKTAEGLIPDVTATTKIDDATHSGTVKFPTITYKRPGTYYYLMREQTSGSGSTEGSNEYQLVNDPSTYLVKVDVTVDEATNKLVAATSYTWMFEGMQEKVDANNVAFYNNEVMMLSMDGAFVEITGEKSWESGDGTQLAVEDDQFRFYLYKYEEGWTAQDYLQKGEPLASASTKAAAQNDKNATFTFYYSISDVPAAGTTLAVVEENAGKTIDGITYSNDVKTVALSWNADKTNVVVDNDKITGDNAFANTSAVSIQVTKAWEDEEGANLTHDPVTVYLYANGKQQDEVKLSEETGETSLTHIWTDLPARDENGNKIVYTVGEKPVDYYTTTITDVTKEDSGVTQSYLITNTFNAEGTVSIDPIITKRVEGRAEGETMTAGEFTFQLADDNGTVLSTATNDAEGHVLFETIRYTEEDIGIHTYTITEVAGSDPHFDYDDSVIQLQVTVARDEANPTQLVTTTEYLNPATGENQTEFVNTYYPIILAVQKTSKDGSNDPLPGAIYGLWMVSETGGEDVYLGNCVADENGYMYFREGIEIGPRYYFKEEFAPEGHTVDEYPSVTFRVEKTDSGYQLVYDADNRLAKNAPSPTAEDGLIDEDLQAIVLEFKDGAVGVQDEVTKLYVNKLDTNTREPVTGAVLQIIEKDTGTVVYQWTSGETTQGMERVLNVDTTYILREVTAPDGYDKAEDTEFIFDAYGNLTVLSGADAEWVGDTTINLYNTKRDVTITRQVTDEVVRQVRQVAHVVRTIPQTGDGTPIVLVASLSLCGVLLIVYLQERKRANRKDR